MTFDQIIRAWKDEEFYSNLSPEEQAGLPVNPIGVVDIHDTELAGVTGGMMCPDTKLWTCMNTSTGTNNGCAGCTNSSVCC